jgi:hypothetical protein
MRKKEQFLTLKGSVNKLTRNSFKCYQDLVFSSFCFRNFQEYRKKMESSKMNQILSKSISILTNI